MKRSPSITSKLPPVLGLAAVLAIWLIASEGGLVPEFMLPSPAQVGAALVSEFPTLLDNASVTLQEAALGLGIGIACYGCCVATARQPELQGRLFTNFIIGAALAEALGLIGFVLTFIV